MNKNALKLTANTTSLVVSLSFSLSPPLFISQKHKRPNKTSLLSWCSAMDNTRRETSFWGANIDKMT